MIKKALKDHKNAQACAVVSDNGIYLVAYTTTVIFIDRDGWLTCTGTYSKTTAKHIGWFLREYAAPLTYYTAKRCYENSEQMNIYTGEVRSIKEQAA